MSEFHPALRGWKLVGHGSQPDSILNRNEKPDPKNRKLPDASNTPSPTVPFGTPKKTSAELGAKIIADLVADYRAVQ